MDESTDGLDATLAGIVGKFSSTHRVDNGQELMRQALRRRLDAYGFSEAEMRLLEVNLFGSLSGWMEFMLEERRRGHNAVPDFARHLRRAFLTHCRQHGIDPDNAIQMAVELATAIMDLAANFKKHLGSDPQENMA